MSLSEQRKEYMQEYRQRPYAKERQSHFHKNWYENGGREKLAKYRRRCSVKKYLKEYYNRNKKRMNVYWNIYYLIKKGKIIKPTKCEVCGNSTYLHGHHEDYSKKFELLWVCVPCHKKIHFLKN